MHWFGARFRVRMTLLKFEFGLVLHSPLRLRDQDQSFMDHLGELRWVVSPNPWHHRFLTDTATRYPEANFRLPIQLCRRYPDLGATPLHHPIPEQWTDSLEPIHLPGLPLLGEFAFWSQPTRTLIFGDFLENIRPSEPFWTRLLSRPHGVYNHYATPRALRWTNTDPQALQYTIDELIDRQPNRIIIGHGPIINANTSQRLREATDWLR